MAERSEVEASGDPYETERSEKEALRAIEPLHHVAKWLQFAFKSSVRVSCDHEWPSPRRYRSAADNGVLLASSRYAAYVGDVGWRIPKRGRDS